MSALPWPVGEPGQAGAVTEQPLWRVGAVNAAPMRLLLAHVRLLVSHSGVGKGGGACGCLESAGVISSPADPGIILLSVPFDL